MSNFDSTHVDVVCAITVFFGTIAAGMGVMSDQYLATALAVLCVGVAIWFYMTN